MYEGGALALGAPVSTVTGGATEIWYEPRRVEDFDGDGQGDYAVMSYDSATLTNAIHVFFAPYDRGGDGYDDQSDCNDNDAQTNPGAVELCDGADQDCDGTPDDGLPMLTWFNDGDGDGFGAGAARTGCAQPSGTASAAGDCDDGDAAVNPGASEVPFNGVDDDCSGGGCSSAGGEAGLSLAMIAALAIGGRRRRAG